MFVNNDLSVWGTCLLHNRLTVYGASDGGNIKSVVAVDNAEASIGFYKCIDQRAIAAGDMWVAGMNSWNRQGCSIGTTTKDACFNITNAGNALIPWTLNVTGTITASHANPYWVAWKVDYDGVILNSSGRNTATINKCITDSGYDITFPTHSLGVNALVWISANEFASFFVINHQLVYQYMRGNTLILHQVLLMVSLIYWY
jgi:hypothetical protein